MSNGAGDTEQAECPQCRTSYFLPVEGIPQTGRSVQCARCSHVWHFVPTGGMPPPASNLSAPTGMAFPVAVPPPVAEPGEPGFKIWFWFFWAIAALMLVAIGILVFRQPLVEEFPEFAPFIDTVLERARGLLP